MKTLIGPALALVVVCAGAGCVSEINSCATWVHQTWTTDSAWRCRKWMYEGVDCESSFKAGFKAGYRFANCGGDFCQPPGPSHFWFANGMTEQDQREAQAWCDGFTHGTLAAQQDGNTRASALDAQAAQPPENTPEVYYYSTPGSIGSIGSPQSGDPFATVQPAPGSYSQSPLAMGTTPFTTGKAPPVPQPPSAWSSAAAPADVAYPPAAPPSESIDLPTGQKGSLYKHYSNSSALPGIGSLRTMVGPNTSDRLSPPTAPSLDPNGNRAPNRAMAGAIPPAPASPMPRSPAPYQSNPSTSSAPKAISEAAPATLPTPSIPSSIPTAPASQWELPIIRN